MCKKALITGITGMDGSYLAEFLLSMGYEVYGIERWKSSYDYKNISHILDRITILKGDLSDQSSLIKCIQQANPDEIYNLAAQSFVGDCWALAEMTSNITGLGVLRMLESIKIVNPNIKFFQATSSEIFGKTNGLIEENSLIRPISSYGAAKAYGHTIVNAYRTCYNIFAVSGILFNHEGHRRSHQFVTRKITDGVAKIKLGITDHITLGNLDSKRDWGYAPDFVKGMWQMLQQSDPDDYILAAGEPKSISDLLEAAFSSVNIYDWQKYVICDPKFKRPADNNYIWGNYLKAYNKFGWIPQTKFNTWVHDMVKCDMEYLQK